MATGPLGALSHDELGVIFDGLADPLQPVVAVALSSTCLGLRTPLRAALEVLQQRRETAKALCRKLWTFGACGDDDGATWGDVPMRSCTELIEAHELSGEGLTIDNMVTLSMILQTNGLKSLQGLDISESSGAGVQAFFEGLGRGATPSLCYLHLVANKIGPAGAEALAKAFRRGAMPKLEQLSLAKNPIGNEGLAALVSLRKLPALKRLRLDKCDIGDEGVASLVAGLGKDDFKALEKLSLDGNQLTDKGCATLVAALNAGALPKVTSLMRGSGRHSFLSLEQDPIWENASDAACAAVKAALDARRPSGSL